MLIGELARKSGVSTRLLRYYEEQGLLRPRRDGNGYRSYAPDDVATVARIRDLLEAGLSTDAIRALLPCTADPEPGTQNCAHSVGILDSRLSQLDARIEELSAQRVLLADYYDATLSRPRDPEP